MEKFSKELACTKAPDIPQESLPHLQRPDNQMLLKYSTALKKNGNFYEANITLIAKAEAVKRNI